jgi:hypothetical protein
MLNICLAEYHQQLSIGADALFEHMNGNMRSLRNKVDPAPIFNVP